MHTLKCSVSANVRSGSPLYVAPTQLKRSSFVVRYKAGDAGGSPILRSRDEVEDIRKRSNEALAPEKMFCYQCEQTMNGTGCTELGICGKSPELAALQDLLMYTVKGLGAWAEYARKNGLEEDQEVNSFTTRAIFSTLTNVNFDDARFKDYVDECMALTERTRQRVAEAGLPPLEAPKELRWGNDLPHPIVWSINPHDLTVHELVEFGVKSGISARRHAFGNTLAGLQELLVYGLKGLCAYATHAEMLGFTDKAVYEYVHEALTFLCSPAMGDFDQVLGHCMKCGEVNYLVNILLSDAHAKTLGQPEVTRVSLRPVPGKCILITGHDMHDMATLLKQTEGKGLNVYTHGEMLPAHSYPELKKYKHLVGHFGGAWYKQRLDFAQFPGSVITTTNCVMDPLQSYKDNVFTVGETGLLGVQHMASNDFSAAINRALDMPGFTEESIKANVKPPSRGEPDRLDHVFVGYQHNVVLGMADKLIDAIKTQKLSHIFVVGGCDGSEPQRKYYAHLYKYMPSTTMVLTMGCGKFRIFDQDFGLLPGTDIPRIMDMGQCNDAYSAMVVAQELAKVFNTDVNSLPLSLDISWFEQKAVAQLLTLLWLGVKNIRLGPRLPAFLTPDATQLMVEKFNLIPADVANPEVDLQRMMAMK